MGKIVMSRDFFAQRKKAVLFKGDKSSIGNWDEKIASLCNKINVKDNYYTTSSCSGRIIVMVDQEKKGDGLFKFVSHDLVNVNEFLKFLNISFSTASPTRDLARQFKKFKIMPAYHEIARPPRDTRDFVAQNLVKVKNKFNKKLNLKFKSEPSIIHIACRNLSDADNLLRLGQKAGFKKMGIITLNKRIVIEISGSDRIEFPLMKDGKLLVDENFLKIVIGKSNENLKKSWEKIKGFEKLI